MILTCRRHRCYYDSTATTTPLLHVDTGTVAPEAMGTEDANITPMRVIELSPSCQQRRLDAVT
jgi:hypothetical protein